VHIHKYYHIFLKIVVEQKPDEEKSYYDDVAYSTSKPLSCETGSVAYPGCLSRTQFFPSHILDHARTKRGEILYCPTFLVAINFTKTEDYFIQFFVD